MSDKEHISYQEIVEECKKLAPLLKAHQFNKIIAITRGGMVPACLLAQLLDIRVVGSISLVSYNDDNQRGEIKCLVSPNIPTDEETLFVDDLCDSGETFNYIRTFYPRAKIAVLYNKSPELALDFPAKQKDAQTWLVFPWDIG